MSKTTTRKPATPEAPPKTLAQAIRYFSDPDVALQFLAAIRWPGGVVCPTCGSSKVTFLATRRLWKCSTVHKRQQFSAKVGTIMEDSAVGLDKWLPAMWLLAGCKNGISSYELARGLDVTQRTAWFMLQRIRLAMQETGKIQLGGSGKVVEADEASPWCSPSSSAAAASTQCTSRTGPARRCSGTS